MLSASGYRLDVRSRILAIAIACVVGACSGPSRPVSEVPEIPTTVAPLPVPPTTCSLNLDTGLGARVQTVSGNSTGILVPDDIVTRVGDSPVRSAGSLVQAVRAEQAGSTVEVDVIRAGSDQTVSVTLGTSSSGDPRLGVIVVTEHQTVQASAAPEDPIAGPLIRAISLAGEVFLVDPSTGAWQATDIEVAPQQIWFVSDGEVYRLEVSSDQNDLFSVGLGSGERSTLELEGRRVLTVVGTFSGAVMLMFENEDDDTLAAFDPGTGSQLWERGVGDITGRTISFANPHAPEIALVANADPQSLVGTVAIVDTDGQPTGMEVTPEDVSGGRLIGWHDRTSLLFSDPENNRRVVVYSLDSGDSETLQLPLLPGLTRLQPVGDGRHLIIQVDDDIAILEPVQGAEPIALTRNCEIGVLTDVGWS